MKKTIHKLVLRKETIRALVDTELSRIVGGGGDDGTICPQATGIFSGCPAMDAYVVGPPEPRLK